MSFSYNPTLPTDLDWTRFLVPDKVKPTAVYSDEEINALVAEQIAKGRTGASTKYYAAAAALSALSGQFALVGGGLRRKEVDDLEVEFGPHVATYNSLTDRIKALEAQGNKCLVGRPRLIIATGGSVARRHYGRGVC